MANRAKTAFEARITKRGDSTSNITGVYLENGENAVCPAGLLCVRSAQKELSGHSTMSNENAFYMTAAEVGQSGPLYAANPYDWQLLDIRERAMYALGINTLGLPIPAGREGTFTEIHFNNKSVYRFGENNVNGTVGANTFFTVENGFLVPAASAPTTDGAIYFELRGSGNFTEGANSSFIYYDVVACSVAGGATPPTPVEEYRAVEYIQSNGDAWIDTGLTLNGAYWFRVDAATLSANGKITAIIVAHQSSAVEDGRQGCMMFNTASHKVDYFWPGVSYTTLSIDSRIDMSERVTITQDASSINFEQNGLANFNVYRGNTEIKGEARLTLLHSDNPNHLSYQMGRIYLAQIRNNNATGEMLRDFVPKVRIADNVAGLFDNVTGEFYTSSGEGGFIAGPEV